jgi:hypothetical protein
MSPSRLVHVAHAQHEIRPTLRHLVCRTAPATRWEPNGAVRYANRPLESLLKSFCTNASNFGLAKDLTPQFH